MIFGPTEEILFEIMRLNGFDCFSLMNSLIDLLRSQTALMKGNAQFPILEMAKAIATSRKYALTFTLRILTSHDEKLMN